MSMLKRRRRRGKRIRPHELITWPNTSSTEKETMNADIEALVLSGKLFNNSSPSNSRPSSPHDSDLSEEDKGWHDEELLQKQPSTVNLSQSQNQSIGMGPGRTGVKGVIRDQQEAQAMSRAQHLRDVEDVNKKMERQNLGGKSYLEEEREKAEKALREGDEKALEKVDKLVLKDLNALAERGKTDVFGRTKEGRFGHLREVGMHNFVSSVEKEERGVWVVVHLYEPSVERCFILDDTLAQLARLYPDTKFLRCRASALGFASSSSSTASSSYSRKPTSTIHRPLRRLREEDDEDEDELGLPSNDRYRDDDDYEDGDDEDRYDEDSVDTDMLPTMLVYRDGELVHNWVRVDWEAGEDGIEELLSKHHILPSQPSTFVSSNLGLPSDGEDDLDDDPDGLDQQLL
ncbi:hypothetical protein D9758_012976 [Tetrapyrgos nigripes]|uniref:Phosducin domain-containing protein n=1 Tax=Tetrapyrgos nigripes TaxID=182062 RepID=A0A8H5FP15_9AGAR|nr:hypothetical protein D9758_012976 [Tetrapyrgos nigripes]